MKSHLTKDFRLCFASLPHRIKRVARENYSLWREDPHHPSLAFKRVGKKTPTYSARIGLGWRALGVRQGEAIIWFWIGSHAEYKELIKRF